MSFLLDTDTCSGFFKNNIDVVRRVMLHFGGLSVSTVTVGELLTWGKRAKAAPSRVGEIEQFLSTLDVLDITYDVAVKFAEIRATLLDQGRPVGELDLFNASVALVHNLTVVTHNVIDYQGVQGLSVVDWMDP